MNRIIVILLFVTTILLGNESAELCIVHTNDIHGVIFPSLDLLDPGVPKPIYGGLDRIAGVINKLRNECKTVLILDAGDFYYGSPEGNQSKGAALVKIMNTIGYDALTLGNHDFAHGRENLRNLARIAKFPFLSANLYDAYKMQHPEFTRPFIIKKIGKLKIAIIGLTTVTTEKIAVAEQLEGLNLTDEHKALAKYLKEVKQAGANLVIALTHLGSKKDYDLAREFPLIDIIIGGHDHAVIEPAKQVGEKTYIVQAGTKGQRLGIHKIKFDLNKERIIEIVSEVKNVTNSMPVDSNVAQLTKELTVSGMDKTVGYNERYLNMNETCDWLASVLKERCEVDVAFVPGSTIRDELPEGAVTPRDIFSLAPFEDKIFTLSIDQGSLKELIESELSGWYRALPIAGVKIFYDPDYAAGGKIDHLEIEADKPFLKIATTEYFLLQKKISTWEGVKNVKATGVSIYEAIMASLHENSRIVYRPEADYVVKKTKIKKMGKINVNTATQRELVALPFIGPTLSKRIIEYRTKNGPFRSVDDLLKVKGIGNKQIDKIKDLIEF